MKKWYGKKNNVLGFSFLAFLESMNPSKYNTQHEG